MSVKAKGKLRPVAALIDRRRRGHLGQSPIATYDMLENLLCYAHKTAMIGKAEMQDDARARRAMVDSQLRPQGVTDGAVLAAMASVPREDYVPAEARAFAYFDRSIPVDGGVMIPPTPLARLLSEAAPQPGERALIVSPAPGYAAALLTAMGLEPVQLRAVDAATVPAGPFAVILIEGAIAEVPAAIADALAEGGRLATALLIPGDVARLAIGRKVGGTIGFTRFADSEIPPLAGFTRPPAFTF